jgi:two-component system chemotaxis response regulator CheB
MPGDKLDIENRIALEGDALSTGVRSLGHPSFYTCPECHGSMVAIREGSIKRFRCHTGHGYTADSLLEEALPRIENSLWGALAQLEERQVLLLELEQSAKESDPGLAARYAAEARRMHRLGRSLRELATDPAFTSTLPPKSAAQPERDRSRNPVIQPG